MSLPPIPGSLTTAAKHRRRCLFIAVSILTVATAVVCLCYTQGASAFVRDISPGCRFRNWTGISCPGCGGTRAARALVHGNLMQSFQYNFLLPFIILGLLLEYVRLGLAAFTRSADWRGRQWYRRYFTLLAWAVPVWVIARNLLGI